MSFRPRFQVNASHNEQFNFSNTEVNETELEDKNEVNEQKKNI